MNAKGVFRAVLLLFVTYSLVVLVAKHTIRGSTRAAREQPSVTEPAAVAAESSGPRLAANRIVVFFYFHGKERCRELP